VFDLSYWMEAKSALSGQPYGKSLPVLLQLLRADLPQSPRLTAGPDADLRADFELNLHARALVSMQPSAFLELLHDTEDARSTMLRSFKEPGDLSPKKATVDDLLRAVGKKLKVTSSRYHHLLAQKQRVTTVMRWTTIERTVFVELLVMLLVPDQAIRVFLLGTGEAVHLYAEDKLKRRLEVIEADLAHVRPVTVYLPT